MGTANPINTAREQTRADRVWYLRHEAALARWPVLKEPWAQQIEERRMAATTSRDTADPLGAGR